MASVSIENKTGRNHKTKVSTDNWLILLFFMLLTKLYYMSYSITNKIILSL